MLLPTSNSRLTLQAFTDSPTISSSVGGVILALDTAAQSPTADLSILEGPTTYVTLLAGSTVWCFKVITGRGGVDRSLNSSNTTDSLLSPARPSRCGCASHKQCAAHVPSADCPQIA